MQLVLGTINIQVGRGWLVPFHGGVPEVFSLVLPLDGSVTIQLIYLLVC